MHARKLSGSGYQCGRGVILDDLTVFHHENAIGNRDR
jgi:hypothetical protein